MGKHLTPVQLLLAVRRMVHECMVRTTILIARISLKERRGTYALTISSRLHCFFLTVTAVDSTTSLVDPEAAPTLDIIVVATLW
jgi:hypothetical protein